mmetsp:Transcript_104350/g.319454  ORF Transcript_104350/g.319454 Transcript_104350/m.319454 type:complete len:220 (-) Transcript_104350:2-661(-)
MARPGALAAGRHRQAQAAASHGQVHGPRFAQPQAGELHVVLGVHGRSELRDFDLPSALVRRRVAAHRAGERRAADRQPAEGARADGADRPPHDGDADRDRPAGEELLEKRADACVLHGHLQALRRGRPRQKRKAALRGLGAHPADRVRFNCLAHRDPLGCDNAFTSDLAYRQQQATQSCQHGHPARTVHGAGTDVACADARTRGACGRGRGDALAQAQA